MVVYLKLKYTLNLVFCVSMILYRHVLWDLTSGQADSGQNLERLSEDFHHVEKVS